MPPPTDLGVVIRPAAAVVHTPQFTADREYEFANLAVAKGTESRLAFLHALNLLLLASFTAVLAFGGASVVAAVRS